MVFLAFFLSLSLRIKRSDSSVDSDESDSDELEEFEDKEDVEEELEDNGSESGFGLGTVLRQGRTSSSSSCCGVVKVAK